MATSSRRTQNPVGARRPKESLAGRSLKCNHGHRDPERKRISLNSPAWPMKSQEAETCKCIQVMQIHFRSHLQVWNRKEAKWREKGRGRQYGRRETEDPGGWPRMTVRMKPKSRGSAALGGSPTTMAGLRHPCPSYWPRPVGWGFTGWQAPDGPLCTSALLQRRTMGCRWSWHWCQQRTWSREHPNFQSEQEGQDYWVWGDNRPTLVASKSAWWPPTLHENLN